MEGFEVVAAIPVCLTTDRESGLAVFRQTVTRYASLPYYRKILDASGLNQISPPCESRTIGPFCSGPRAGAVKM